jgi:hypothetical protein
MRLLTGLSGAEFALLARLRATSRAMDALDLFQGRLLGFHEVDDVAVGQRKMVSLAQKLMLVGAKSQIPAGHFAVFLGFLEIA